MALEQVNTVTLPAIFREIGCWLGKTKKAPPASFQHHFDALAVLKPAAESKNPQAIGRLDDVYVALGREAYEKYGDKAVPKEIAPHLAAALSKRWEYLAILERAGKATDNALDPPRSAAPAPCSTDARKCARLRPGHYPQTRARSGAPAGRDRHRSRAKVKIQRHSQHPPMSSTRVSHAT